MSIQRPIIRLPLESAREGPYSPKAPNVAVVPNLISPASQKISPQAVSHHLAADTVSFTTPAINLPSGKFTTMFQGVITFPNIPYQQYPTSGPQPIGVPTENGIKPAKDVSMRLLVHGVLTAISLLYTPHFSLTPVVADRNNVTTSGGTLHPGSKYNSFGAMLTVISYNPQATTIVGATLSLDIHGHLIAGIPTLG